MTDDGGEMDLDLGNYERYLLTTLTRDHNITVGHPELMPTAIIKLFD